MYFALGKKGEAEEVSWPQVIFLVLVIAFMAVFFIFARNSLTGSLVQEEVYAKKIALLIDSAKPGTDLFLDITPLNEVSTKSQGKNLESQIITLDSDKNSVMVSLRLGNRSYHYPYFTDYNVSGQSTKIGEKLFYLIKIEEKKK